MKTPKQYQFIFLLFLPLLLPQALLAGKDKKPKLIVGIVVDQMRNDYIYRYWNRFGSGGFKRLVSNGCYFRNAHYNYVPTYTGPGHCSIYTGTTPRSHGIIANDWHIQGTKKTHYCVRDTLTTSIGSGNKNGQMSPRQQLASTIGDELKMSQPGSKVFGIALKDRSAILPAGHAANAAFWFDDESGSFISSSWYMLQLPAWLNAFNAQKKAATYLAKSWNTLYPLETYSASIADNNPYENVPSKKELPVFPYDYSKFIAANSFGILKSTPYGNSITKDLAMACIDAENLGLDEQADLLTISFSTPDYVAHAYGPRSVEAEDIYLRLDRDLEELLNYLDKKAGKDNYIVFLTADHGGADVPQHLIDSKIPAGYSSEKKIMQACRNYSQKEFGDSLLIEDVSNEQIFLDLQKLQQLNLNKTSTEDKLAAFLIRQPGVAEAWSSAELRGATNRQGDFTALLQNGYNQRLSGHVSFMYLPGWMDYAPKGTTHGAGYNYDTHVPVIFYGAGIKKGTWFDYVAITQIAPTVCELLKINQPNACNFSPLKQVLK